MHASPEISCTQVHLQETCTVVPGPHVHSAAGGSCSGLRDAPASVGGCGAVATARSARACAYAHAAATGRAVSSRDGRQRTGEKEEAEAGHRCWRGRSGNPGRCSPKAAANLGAQRASSSCRPRCGTLRCQRAGLNMFTLEALLGLIWAIPWPCDDVTHPICMPMPSSKAARFDCSLP